MTAPRWPVRLAAAAGLAAVAVGPSLPPQGPTLIEVLRPAPGATVGLEGVELLVRFPPSPLGDLVASETFRALLNGADVTDSLTTSENGAYGQLSGLLEGDNVLRLEIFGRLPWSRDSLFEQARELRVRMRPPRSLDQAQEGEVRARGSALGLTGPPCDPRLRAVPGAVAAAEGRRLPGSDGRIEWRASPRAR